MTDTLSVVIPVFNNRDTLTELCERVAATAQQNGWVLELILVDDCSTDDSWRTVSGIARTLPVRVLAIRTPRNLGQHIAILVGLLRARRAWCAVLDADLQDSPEVIPALIAASEGCDVVFAGRRGRHQGLFRHVTGMLYRRLLSLLSGLPPDAGTFCVLRRDAVDRILALRVATPSFLAMMGLANLRARSIPVQRNQRRSGASAYSTRLRLRVAARMLRCVAECRLRPAPRAIREAIEALSAASRGHEAGNRAEP